MSNYTIRNQGFTAKTVAPGLYIVATPIGNLGDMTIRGLEVLAAADVIACEDTRVTGKLLLNFGIKAKTISYHEHNAKQAGENIIELLKQGKCVALTSDAGTPLVSDPGQRLVQTARNEGLSVYPIPGASAPLAALMTSGISTQRFSFLGFLPNKQTARKNELKNLMDEKGTLVFFESPSRITACLNDMSEIFGQDRMVSVCRELTKMHEEVKRGSLSEIAEHFAQATPKGEFVIVLAPKAEDDGEVDIDALLLELMQTSTVSRAASEAAKLTERSKRDLYQRALALKDEAGN